MTFQMIAFDKLAKSVQLSITSLIKSKGFDKLNQDEAIKKLDRRIQVLLLLTFIDVLQNSSEDKIEKARILNAVVCYIRMQIFKTYRVFNAEGSDLYNLLTSSLELNKDNEPRPYELAEMYDLLSTFIYSYVFVSPDPEKGYIKNSPFSEEKIKGFFVDEIIDNLDFEACDIMKKLKEEVRERSKKEKKSSLNFFSNDTKEIDLSINYYSLKN